MINCAKLLLFFGSNGIVEKEKIIERELGGQRSPTLTLKIRCLVGKIIRLIILNIPLIVTRKMGILFSASEKLCAPTTFEPRTREKLKKTCPSGNYWG